MRAIWGALPLAIILWTAQVDGLSRSLAQSLGSSPASAPASGTDKNTCFATRGLHYIIQAAQLQSIDLQYLALYK